MQAISPILIGLGLLLPAAEPARLPEADPARLQETLRDRRDPAGQSQAALLLVQCPTEDAENAVRQALEQTEEVDVFSVLAGAVRLCQDDRFAEELLAALRSVRPLGAPGGGRGAGRLAACRSHAPAQGDRGGRQIGIARPSGGVVGAGAQRPQGRGADFVGAFGRRQRGACKAAPPTRWRTLAGQSFGVDAARWREWWDRHKDMSNDRWLEMRLACQTSRVRRLEGDLERARMQVLRLQQQVYSRLPAADRPNYIQTGVGAGRSDGARAGRPLGAGTAAGRGRFAAKGTGAGAVSAESRRRGGSAAGGRARPGPRQRPGGDSSGSKRWWSRAGRRCAPRRRGAGPTSARGRAGLQGAARRSGAGAAKGAGRFRPGGGGRSGGRIGGVGRAERGAGVGRAAASSFGGGASDGRAGAGARGRRRRAQ